MATLLSRFLLLFTAFSVITGNAVAASFPATSLPTGRYDKSIELSDIAPIAAASAFKGLTHVDQKLRIKAAKRMVKEYQVKKMTGVSAKSENEYVLLVLLAVLLPPLVVRLYEKEINRKFWISLLLTLAFWLPGAIYASVVIFGED